MLVNFFISVIEAGWLIALAGIPIFFNPYSTRIFEADKTYILRSITLIILAAWLVQAMSQSRKHQSPIPTPNPQLPTPNSKLSNLLPILVAVFAGVYFISSIFSINPYFSFKGYFLREEGFYTFICYIIIFFALLSHLKRQAQLDRIINVIILTSTVISIYGILQSFKIDVVDWAGGVDSARVASTLGNPIFLGAYLVVVIPILLMRLVASIKQELPHRFIPILIYAVLLLINITCLISAFSRGPLVGWLTGLFLFAILYTRLQRMRKLFLSIIIVVLIIVTFVIILNVPNSPIANLRHYFGRFGQLYEADSGSGKVRLLIWQSAVNIYKSSPARWAFGYGLESLPALYHTNVPASYARYEGASIPDHSHNEIFDILLTAGAVGVIVYLAIFLLLVYYIFKHLQLLSSRPATVTFILLIIITTLLGLIVPIALGQAYLIGLGIPFGFLAGLIIYIIIFRYQDAATLPDQWLLLIGLLSAIIGHFMELQFGIGVTSTRLYFWVYLAIIICLIKSPWPVIADSTQPAVAPAKPAAPQGNPSKKLAVSPAGRDNHATIYGLIHGLIIALLLFTILNKSFILSRSVPNNLYLILAAIVVISAIWMIFVLKSKLAALIYLCTMFVWSFVFYLVLYSYLKDGTQTAIPAFNFAYVFIFFTLMSVAYFISRHMPWPAAKQAGQPIGIVYFLILLLVAFAIIYQTNLREAYADIYCLAGQALEKTDPPKWSESVLCYKKSIALSPRTDMYYEALSRAYNGMGDFQKAIDALNQAIERNKYNLYHYFDMARYYRNWSNALVDTDHKASDAKLALALEVYQKILVLAPKNARIVEETGEVYFLQNDFKQAAELARKSIEMDERFPPSYLLLARAYQQLNESPDKPAGSPTNTDKTIAAFSQALKNDPGNKDLRHEIMQFGESYYMKHDWAVALKVNQALAAIEPDDFQHVHNCAVILDEMGRVDEAITYEKKAIDLNLFPMQKDGLKKYLQQLQDKKAAQDKK